MSNLLVLGPKEPKYRCLLKQNIPNPGFVTDTQ